MIPKTFKLAGFDFNVEIVDNVSDGEEYGDYLDVTNTIQIAQRVKIDKKWYNVNGLTQENTFWHELFHVFNYYWNTEFNESLAQVFANFMIEYQQTVNYDAKVLY